LCCKKTFKKKGKGLPFFFYSSFFFFEKGKKKNEMDVCLMKAHWCGKRSKKNLGEFFLFKRKKGGKKEKKKKGGK